MESGPAGDWAAPSSVAARADVERHGTRDRGENQVQHPGCLDSGCLDSGGLGLSTYRTTWTAANKPKDTEKVPAQRANRRSFDYASRDETARPVRLRSGSG